MNNKIKILPIDKTNCVTTTFNCPIELRDRLEETLNQYIGIYTTEEIMNALLSFALDEFAD